MLSNTQIKFFKSLHKKKYRTHYGKILLEGHRLISQAIKFDANIDEIWITDEYKTSEQFKQISKEISDSVFNLVSKKSINQVSESKNNQGIIALTSLPNYNTIVEIPNKSIYLDKISDPGNMGSLLRTACWFGIQNIFLSLDCVDIFNSKVIRSAMGAHFYFNGINIISFEKLNFDDLLIIGGDIGGKNLKELLIPKKKKWILILGSEAHGISSSIKPFINHRVSIKGYCEMESLNVVSAGSILLNHLIN